MLEYASSIFPHWRNVLEKICGLCRQTVYRTYTIFSAVYAMSDKKSILYMKTFEAYLQERVRTDKPYA